MITSHRRAAFTLIEVLVVMSIIIILISLLTVGLMGARDKAKNKGSRGLVNQIKIALESYHGDFREYPPDGYESEGGAWDFTVANGIKLGTPPGQQYEMKGTAALMYFLCRPLIKIQYVGADISDPRNRVQKRVGPYLELNPDNYSMKRREMPDGEVVVFNPNHNWEDDVYWETVGYKNCEIIDSYGRPLCYDKVKTSDIAYFDPAQFQAGSAPPAGKGYKAHPHQEAFDDGTVDLLPSNEPEAFREADYEDILVSRFDPRFISYPSGNTLTEYIETIIAGDTPGTVPPGDTTTHGPQFTGGYDLWSSGRSWVDPRDDIMSWGN